jgi:hypothetical protein
MGRVSNMAMVIALVASTLASCAGSKEMILEYNDVQFFRAVLVSKSALEVSGLSFHSSMTVKNVDAKQKDDKINISVYLQSASRGGRGDFNYKLSIPGSVNMITFGPTHEVIWRRNDSRK